MDIATTEAATLATARLLFEKFGRQGMDGIVDMLDAGCVGTPPFEAAGSVRDNDGAKVQVRALSYEVAGSFAIVHGSLRYRRTGELSETQVYWRFGIRDRCIVSIESFPSRDAAVAGLRAAA